MVNFTRCARRGVEWSQSFGNPPDLGGAKTWKCHVHHSSSSIDRYYRKVCRQVQSQNHVMVDDETFDQKIAAFWCQLCVCYAVQVLRNLVVSYFGIQTHRYARSV